MSRSLEGLYRSLEPLRLYALRQDSYIDRELAAYGEGFGAVEALFDSILDEAFAGAAGGGRPGTLPMGCTPEGMKAAILALGVKAELIERAPEGLITLRVESVLDPALDLATLKRLVLAVLPAHLECVFETGGVTWDAAEDRFDTWDAWDAEGIAWDALELTL